MQTQQLLTAADASVPQSSVWQRLGDLQLLSLQVVFSSNTLNGTLTLESDNVQVVVPTLAPVPNYITGSSQVIASGATHTWNIQGAGYGQVRATWTPTSGTGTISIYEILKQDGLNRN